MCLRRCGHVPGKGVCLFFAGTCQRKGSVPFFLRARVKGKGVCHFVCACAASSSQDSFFYQLLKSSKVTKCLGFRINLG